MATKLEQQIQAHEAALWQNLEAQEHLARAGQALRESLTVLRQRQAAHRPAARPAASRKEQ